MIITDIYKTRRGRYALLVDGEFYVSVHKNTYLTTPLRPGLELTDQELEELRGKDESYSAIQSALDILSRAAQCSEGLRDKLLRRYSAEATEGALLRMAQLGLLDDQDYAFRLARDMVGLRRWSLARVRQELLRRKLDRETVEEALAQFVEQDEVDIILQLLLKKYRHKLLEQEDRSKVISALKRRGFNWEDICIALRQIDENGLLEEAE